MTTEVKDTFHSQIALSQTEKFLDPDHLLSQTSLKANQQVGDLGCGSGHLAFAAARIINPNGIVYAVDIRDAALRNLESQKRLFGERNIKTIKADLTYPKSTGLPDASMDLTILAAVIHQLGSLEGRQALFSEAKRITREEGEILILEWQKEKGPPGPVFEKRVGAEEVKKLVADAGLKIVKNLKTDSYHYAFLAKLA